MKTNMAAVVTMALLIAAQLSLSLASPLTTPAFLWLPQHGRSSNRMIKAVNYRTISPRDLAESVMSEGGWSNSLCMETTNSDSLDFAVLFVGKKLLSRDIFGIQKDPILADHLKAFFADSNSSLAFPYIAASDDDEAVESSLLAHFEETCGSSASSAGIRNVATIGGCSLDGEKIEKLDGISSVGEYMALRMERKVRGLADLIVVCHGDSQSELAADELLSEVKIFSQLMSYVKELEAKYTFLYVSDPRGSVESNSRQKLERLLAESSFGNVSANSTCDGICQIKSSLLEGILVGIVLLIILISGLCCMAGIDTPTRFEAAQDS